MYGMQTQVRGAHRRLAAWKAPPEAGIANGLGRASDCPRISTTGNGLDGKELQHQKTKRFPL